ncbi:conserved hypothetical protein [Burkholderia mallei GB8 horse 4]|nr:conserved hypothetical protein [Burkholderia mallei GB8 horse 4]
MHARRAAKPQHFDDVDCRARVDRCVREPDASAYSERRCARAREPGWRARALLADANAGRRTCGERRRSAGGHWDQRADVNRGERGRFRRADGPCARARGVRCRAALGRAARRHGGGSRRLIDAINRSG